MKLYSQGAAQEVTGSKHILDTGRSKIMVDCGSFQGRRRESEEKNRSWIPETDELDAVLLTHGHFDHCGLLPLLCKKGFTNNIYATAATRDIANIIMMDSAKIQARDAEYLRKQAEKRGEQFNWEPLYNEEDALQATRQFVTLSYERQIYAAPDISIRFYDAGHILGSSSVYCEVNNGGTTMRIGFSGDVGRKNKPIIRDPVPIPPVDYLVLESTYGDRLHEDVSDIMEELGRIVRETAERGGKIIIPAFAVERTQDIIYYLHLLSDQKKIPQLPIFIDSPMAVNATSIFRVHPECYDAETREAFLRHHKNPFGFNSLRYVDSVAESKEINKLSGPAIIISASGMCEAGRIVHHLLHTIAEAKNTVLIVGYMAAHTLGRRIRDREKEVRIFGNTIPLRARVEEIRALSSHADYSEMGEYVRKLDLEKLKTIFLVHGEEGPQRHFQKYLLDLGAADVQIVQYGEEYELG
jgi:metallo-beta-lactamase family protein